MLVKVLFVCLMLSSVFSENIMDRIETKVDSSLTMLNQTDTDLANLSTLLENSTASIIQNGNESSAALSDLIDDVSIQVNSVQSQVILAEDSINNNVDQNNQLLVETLEKLDFLVDKFNTSCDWKVTYTSVEMYGVGTPNIATSYMTTTHDRLEKTFYIEGNQLTFENLYLMLTANNGGAMRFVQVVEDASLCYSTDINSVGASGPLTKYGNGLYRCEVPSISLDFNVTISAC